jgi:hypothetical protein
MRLFRDPLERRFDPTAPSYWTRRTAAAISPKSYEQQF